MATLCMIEGYDPNPKLRKDYNASFKFPLQIETAIDIFHTYDDPALAREQAKTVYFLEQLQQITQSLHIWRWSLNFEKEAAFYAPAEHLLIR
ncbi:MAG: hypothetical protein HGA85_06530 [Nanoarchaeota archaeon]|nr:hypothetical protein [Nanoarchaeota archaeon]